MSVLRDLGAWLLMWLGASVVVAAALWLSLWRLENELQWRDAAFPWGGVALVVAGAALRARARQS